MLSIYRLSPCELSRIIGSSVQYASFHALLYRGRAVKRVLPPPLIPFREGGGGYTLETILYGDGLQHDKIAQDFKSRYSALGSKGHKGFKKQKYIFYFRLYTIQCVAYYCKNTHAYTKRPIPTFLILHTYTSFS